MSFQDFTGRPAPGRSTAVAAAPSSGGARLPNSTTMGQGSLNQISESLLQYQRNVGILEKIVHSLTATAAAATSGAGGRSTYNNRTNREELELQYRAQADVISQLGDKVHKLIADQKKTEKNVTIRTTLIKLERDFERVQSQAEALTRVVTKMKASQQQKAAYGAASFASSSSSNEGGSALEDYQRQMQMQLQEDRLAEQIMREREEEIRNINRGMHQVNEIYKDLAHIVASQQEQVDAIETKMEDSRDNAQAGLTQIEKANENYGASNCVIS